MSVGQEWRARARSKHTGNRQALAIATLALVTGCAINNPAAVPSANAQLTPLSSVTRDLMQLPPPRGKVVVAVYAFRHQTGQYKPSPDSSFSTSVTQGAASFLVKALRDSGWYTSVERENLQNLLTERKIVRALEMPQEKNAPVVHLPQLLPAAIIIEGGILTFESNVRTGGGGANYLGIGITTQYRVDQVTVNLRSIDIRSGQIVNSVSTTKAILSYEIKPSVFKFVNFKDLVHFEAGITRNEPAQLCVQEAIEAGVIHLTLQGLQDGLWALRDDKDWSHPVLQRYLKETGGHPPLAPPSTESINEKSKHAQSICVGHHATAAAHSFFGSALCNGDVRRSSARFSPTRIRDDTQHHVAAIGPRELGACAAKRRDGAT